MLLLIGRQEGRKVTRWTWLWLWLTELRITAEEQPMLLVPHPHRASRCGPGDGYRCLTCGSRSARVQQKGRREAETIRRQLA